MTSLSLLTLAAAFACMFCLDIAWAVYTASAASGQPMRASAWAVVLHLLGSATTIIYTDDPRYLAGTVVGAFAGTYAGVRWTQRKKGSTCSQPLT